MSAYHLAEWLGWNWWRLRWEPRTRSTDWALAHRLTTIGGGYVWPNITISSDGERLVLLAKPTRSRPEEPLRYLADMAIVVRAAEFEDAVDRFVEQVRGQLRAEGIADTNLDGIWRDLVEERRDPTASAYRKFEALLGYDPDEANEGTIRALLADAADLGEQAVSEIAANRSPHGDVLTADRLRAIAATDGFAANPKDIVRLASGTMLSPIGQVPAWKRGAEAAQALRMQLDLGAAPLSNQRLAQLAGVTTDVLARNEKGRGRGADISFVLDDAPANGRVVLRAPSETGRRFELARLLGDRIAGRVGERLFPATRSYTYRQRVQRSFAAEFLCPFKAVDEMLGDDISQDALEDAAHHFTVSPLTVRTLLVNHGRLGRETLNDDVDAAA